MNPIKLISLMLICILLTGCSGVTQLFATPTPTLPPPTATPVPIPGIDVPITIEGVEVQLTSLSREAKYEIPGGMQTFYPASADDVCLIIETTISATDTKGVQGWEVFVTDENGRESKPSLTTTRSYEGGAKKNTAMWLLVVAKSSKALILHFPGNQTIDLSSLDK